jgi:aspartyl-tRNA(Asn)/glutamyl-tRNA(Gln) amidotransferase subunit C
MALTQAEVRKIGLVARLNLDDAAIEGLQEELNQIPDYVEQMQELDLDGVKPTAYSTDLSDSLRDDVQVPGLTREAALMNAPESKEGAFLIPRIKAPGSEETKGIAGAA